MCGNPGSFNRSRRKRASRRPAATTGDACRRRLVDVHRPKAVPTAIPLDADATARPSALSPSRALAAVTSSASTTAALASRISSATTASAAAMRRREIGSVASHPVSSSCASRRQRCNVSERRTTAIRTAIGTGQSANRRRPTAPNSLLPATATSRATTDSSATRSRHPRRGPTPERGTASRAWVNQGCSPPLANAFSRAWLADSLKASQPPACRTFAEEVAGVPAGRCGASAISGRCGH